MKEMRASFLFFFLLVVGAMAPSLLYAQNFLEQQRQVLDVDLEPQFPKPNEPVRITIESYTLDLNAAEITWSVNDSVQERGVGKKSFVSIANDIGSISRITVNIVPLSGLPFQKEIIIRPTNVSLVWEAHTYTPPFYKGRAHFTPQSSVTIAALPEISLSSSSRNDLIYHWYRNKKPAPYRSGYGVSSIPLEGNFWGREENIRVKVTNRDESIVTEGTLFLELEEPTVVVYENNPLLGILYNNAIIDSFKLTNSEVSFFAAPYYFDTNRLEMNGTDFSWSMNRQTLADQGNGNVATFRADTNLAGQSQIDISVSQPETTFQNAEKSFFIEFN